MAGHIIRMSPGRPANHAMSWTPRGSGRRQESSRRPTKTWQSTFKEDLVDRSRLKQRPGCGYKQEQMANSCCPLSCQGHEDLSAKSVLDTDMTHGDSLLPILCDYTYRLRDGLYHGMCSCTVGLSGVCISPAEYITSKLNNGTL